LICYLDTSLLVTALTGEVAAARVLAWFGKRPSDRLAISDWVVTEFAAALSVKLRTRQLTPEARAAVAAQFAAIRSETLETLPVFGEHFRAAARFADQAPLGLRAGDALHVAIAAEHGATICTLDKRLAEAATALAVSTELV
jgi:predicted nucleic acid-binding protein